MNAKKKLALLLSLVLLLMLLPVAVHAEAEGEASSAPMYLALGDSISYGLTDLSGTGGYVGMVDFYLNTPQLVSFDCVNLSFPGDTTLDLLGVIGKNHKLVKDAEIITISIGSNHLLGPAIDAIVGLFGIDPEDYKALDGQDMLFELALRMKMDWIDGGLNPAERLASLTGSTPQADSLNQAWMEGSAMFTRKWSLIIEKIRKNNPDAVILVNNVYNPIKLSVLSSSASPAMNMVMSALYGALDAYIQQINDVIEACQAEHAYNIVDVYGLIEPATAYAGYLSDPANSWSTAPVVFNIPMALNLTNPVLNPSFDPTDPDDFMPFFLSCDPHPTTSGHVGIATLVVNGLS